MIVAHRDEDSGKEQSLMDHLLNTAKIAKKIGDKIDQGSTMFLIGLLHDIGKADRLFQDMIKNQKKSKVDHSSAGGSFVLSLVEEVVSSHLIPAKDAREYFSIIAYVITAHHGLYDIPSRNKDMKRVSKFIERVNHRNRKDYNFEEDVLTFGKSLEKETIKDYGVDFKTLAVNGYKEYVALKEKLKPKEEVEESYYISMVVRLYLSILKNGDILDTINSYEEIIKPEDEEERICKSKGYLKSIEDLYSSFENPKEKINQIRTKLGEQSRERGKKDTKGIYRLNLPTGAGKTLISLRYGMHQLNFMDKERFIYITAFLSVLEQNAKEIKEVLKDEDILEHHSNIVKSMDTESPEVDYNLEKKKSVYREYLTDTWDSQVVLSTMVQFCNTIFKGRSSNIRRFSSLINSCIILDEVQSLPIEMTYLFNLAMNFISKAMNTTIILCTATQPLYDEESIEYKISYGGDKGEKADLVTMTEEERKVFDRNTVYKLNDGEGTNLDDVAKEILAHPDSSMITILNTKKAAKDLYDLVTKSTERKTYYLSTSLCPAHRKDIISKMKKELRSKDREKSEPIICISTQLIEAGVDVDFDRLIKSYAGIDSIIQAIGRCNRENKDKTGIVMLVNLNEEIENISCIESIKEKKEVTKVILNNLEDPIKVEELNDRFYKKYYANNQKKMYYSLGKDKGNLLDLLSINKHVNINAVLTQSFKTAAEKFNLIDDDSESVIVYYKESEKLIEKLLEYEKKFTTYYKGEDLLEIKKLLDKLKPYTIPVLPNSKIRDYVMEYLDSNIKILTKENYDEKVGAKIDTNFIL